jgi:hypothetical protein
MSGHTKLKAQRKAKSRGGAADVSPFSSAASHGKSKNANGADIKVVGKKGRKRINRRKGYADGGTPTDARARYLDLTGSGMSKDDTYAKMVHEGYGYGSPSSTQSASAKPDAGVRYRELTAGGLSQDDTYAKMRQEGY